MIGEPGNGGANIGSLWFSFLLTTVFCLAIAGMLSAIGVSPFQDNLLISLCIGWSINSLFRLLREPFEPRIGVLLTSAVITFGGLLIGVLLASTLLHGKPLLILLNAPSTLVLGVTFGIIGYLIFGTRGRLLASELQVALLEREQAEQRQHLVSTELKLLQAQIEPHFLFNTLSNIQSLIHDEPAKADAMLEQLTVLLRGSLAGTRRDSTTVSEELALVRAYLEIQQIRIGERLHYSITAGPTVASLKLPPLLLQPLVENAITHGIERRPGLGTVRIEVSQIDGGLRLTVTDDGPGLNAAALTSDRAGHGTALRNIRERLQSRYGDRASLRLFEAQPQGVTAELVLHLDAAEAVPA